ncbi:MAG: sigma-70 family RNA polymerase sigma factor [Pyrinomonadaceae bacterium]|nr:sigma-70 family RNA polymerase sigma factor [Pyrinomonadaceae bacterium]
MSTTTARNMLFTSESSDAADGAIQNNLIAESAALEELGALFRDHHKTVFRIAYRITGSRSDAEDVLQTIFLRLTPSRRDLSPNPEGYLHRAAVNASLDLIRRRARANFVALDNIDFSQNAKLSTPSPEDGFADGELRELIRHAVAKLEGRAATAFALRYFEGYDNARIAKVLGTSQLVVAVTLHRARTRLRKEIGNYLEKHHEA